MNKTQIFTHMILLMLMSAWIGYCIADLILSKQPCYCAKQVICGVDINTASQSGGLRYEL